MNMSFNSSSSSNFTLPRAQTFCFNFRLSFFIFTAFSATNILLLLPFCSFVIYLGVKRWRKRRSAPTAANTSNSDIFTYHMVTMEMIGVTGCGFYCCGAGANVPGLMMVGVYFFSVTSNGQIFFHILTCLERHLAVVHPITYLALKKRSGVTIRNVLIGCVWLFFFGSFGLTTLSSSFSTIPFFCLSVLAIVIVLFCSFSVLRALIRPGPGEGGGDKERVNQTKMRAFHTIMAIMGALLLRFGGHLLVLTIHASTAVSEHVRCGVLVSGVFFCLPSSLVLPLLFLHRAGKLILCKNKTESEQESE